MDYSEKVLNQFFQPYYECRIELLRNKGEIFYSEFDIALSLFCFSIIDFYGGLFYVGRHNKVCRNKYKNLILATQDSFTEFVEEFFPKPDNELGVFLYKIFRSGLVHQLSPKKAGLYYQPENPKLIWIDHKESSIQNRLIANINLFKLDEYVYNSYKKFKHLIEIDGIPNICKNITEKLINEDILEDVTTINNQYSKLSDELKEYITIRS